MAAYDEQIEHFLSLLYKSAAAPAQWWSQDPWWVNLLLLPAHYAAGTKKEKNQSTQQKPETLWFHLPAQLDELISTIAVRGATADVKISINPRREKLDGARRGKIPDLSAVLCAVIEIDYASAGGHSALNLPADAQKAQEFIESLPIQPTFITDSGGGLHCYYMLDAPAADATQAQIFFTAYQNHIIKVAKKQQGWQLDAVASVEAAFRPAGAFNHKLPNRRPCKIIKTDGPRTPLGAFGRYVKSSKEKAKKGKTEETSLNRIADHCGWVNRCRNEAASLPEPEWWALGCIAARCESDGEELWHEWSKEDQRYNYEEASRKLQAARDSRPPLCATIQERFLPEECERCQYNGKIRGPIQLGTEKEQQGADWLLGFPFDEWAYVIEVKRFAQWDPVKRRQPVYLYDAEQFNAMQANPHIGMQAARLLLAAPAFRKLAKLTYLPGANERIVVQEGQAALNCWTPSAIVPSPEVKLSNIRKHLKHLMYLLPVKIERRLVQKFMAHLIQRPQTKIRWALLLHSKEEGIGKSYLVDAILMQILGHNNVSVIYPDTLKEAYTSWIANKQLVTIEEMMADGRLTTMNKLKPMITQPIINVREMYQPFYQVSNYANFLLFSNYDDSIILRSKDRRYAVLESFALPRSEEYYIDLFADAENNISTICSFYSKISLTGFHATGRAPNTEAKERLVEDSRPPLEQWMKDLIDQEIWPMNCDLINTAHIAAMLPGSIKGVSSKKIANVLKSLGCHQLPNQIHCGDVGKLRLWVIRNYLKWSNVKSAQVAEHYMNWLNSTPINPIESRKPL